MDAFELLKTDHEKVSQLFKEIESASGQRKRQVFTQLKAELDVHAHIEEKILYPALENTEEAREITLEAYEEHKVVKDLLAELASGGAPNEEWDAKLTVLKENVEHHVEEEEGELFSKARKALSSEEIDRIGAELEVEKARQQGASVKTQDAKRRSTKAGAGARGGASRRSSREAKESESPGVLKRIANFIGLGGDSSTGAKKKKKAGKASKTSKKSAASQASTSGKSAKGKAGQPAAKSAQKSAAKKSATRAKSAGKTSGASKRSAATKTKASRANKRVPASRKGVRSSKAAAPRSASKKK
jgi:iron-sulfur cluster repair protein YtfE (RIC family)